MIKFHNYIKQLISVIGLYILFFNPNFILLGSLTIKILYPILIICLCLNFKSYCTLLKDVWIESSIILLLLLYSIILTVLADGDIEIFKGVIMLSLGYLLIPILSIIINKNKTLKGIINLVICVGVTGCIISIVCFIFPELNSNLRELQFSTSHNLTELSFRGFGISNGLFFYYPIILSLIMIIYLEQDKSFLLKLSISIIFLFTIFINARIGIFPLIIYCILKCYRRFKLACELLIGIIFLIFIIIYIGTEYENTTFGFICKWILGGIGQITNPLFGTNFETLGENHFETLGGKMFFLPSRFEEIIFGTGINLFGRSSGLKSDVGYTIQLYYGGIIIFTLICGLISCMTFHISKSLKKRPEFRRLILVLFLCTITISNFKGDFLFQMNGGFFFLYFIYIQIILSCRQNLRFYQSSQ